MSGKPPETSPLTLLWVFVPIVMLATGQTLGKLGALQIAAGAGVVNPPVVAGYALLILRGLIWIFILRKLKLLLAYPLMSLSYIIVLVISSTVFDEIVTRNNVLGSLLIVFGVTMLSLGEARMERKTDA